VIRRATPEDADELAKLLRAAMNGAMPWLADLHTPEEDRWFMREVVLQDEVWVADVDGRPVGFVALGSRAGSTYLQHLYVLPEHQRNGVGSELMAHAKAQRPDGFRLWVFQRNEGARRFYEKHELRLVEVTDGSGNEEKEPDALYEWAP
jgi:ribosomal protein S18 acetylase RimI-like enzyme